VRGVRYARRVLVTLVGGFVLVAGIAMLVLPGPGLLSIAAGFAILSTEYEWAHARVEAARHRARQMSELAASSWRALAVSVLFGLGLGALGTLYLVTDGLLPFDYFGTGIGLVFGGLCVLVGTVFGDLERRAVLRERSAGGTKQQ
jgi:hypothetical protein